MNRPNPYEPPTYGGGPANSSRDVEHLVKKATRLLQQRDKPLTLATYLVSQWRRHLVMALLFGGLCLVAAQFGDLYFVVAVAAFWAGRFVRDIQWYRTLVREWKSTKELLDWDKIKDLAA